MRPVHVLFALVLPLAGVPAARGRVALLEGLTVGDRLVVRTDQRVVHVVPRPGLPAVRAGRLPRTASRLVAHGDTAWAARTGEARPGDVVLLRLQGLSLQRVRPAFPAGARRVVVTGIAGADGGSVYLEPDLRLDVASGRLAAGHLDGRPGARVRQVVDGPAGAVLLLTGPDGRASLLGAAACGLPEVELGAGGEPPRVTAAGDDLVVLDGERALRLDGCTLDLLEDLSPMLPSARVEWLSADAESYWMRTGDGLWRASRADLDGARVDRPDRLSGYRPFADDGDRAWLASPRPDRSPLASWDKATGAVTQYRVRGVGARRARLVGRSLSLGLQYAVVGAAVGVVGGVAVASAPIWIPAKAATAARRRAGGEAGDADAHGGRAAPDAPAPPGSEGGAVEAPAPEAGGAAP